MRKALLYTVLGVCSFAFTAFVYVNAYEIIFNQPVAFAVSLRRVASQSTINNLMKEFAVKPGNADSFLDISHLDDMESIAVPSQLNLHVNVETARNINGTWYQRPSLAGYVPLNKNTQDVAIDYLIFTDASWRTIPFPDKLEVGMDVQIFHKGGNQSTFRIAQKVVAPIGQNLLINMTVNRQIILLVEEPAGNIYYGFDLEQGA